MLTQEQLEASQSPHENTVVIAGPGTGKTTLLIARVQYLIESGVQPESILVLTFTRKAANEIKERLAQVCDVDTSRIMAGTFHSVALELLCNHRKAVPITEDVAESMVVEISKTMRKPVSKLVMDCYRTSRAMGKCITAHESIIKATETYERQLKMEGLIDWLGMLLGAIELGELLPAYEHVITDEDQDTDDLQRKFSALLGRKAKKFSVGDDRQQLYEWRGVRPDSFTKQPGHRYYLTKTFRFQPGIAALTNQLAKCAGSASAPDHFQPARQRTGLHPPG